jgi:tetratricopeptide (TPR) repeat protein
MCAMVVAVLFTGTAARPQSKPINPNIPPPPPPAANSSSSGGSSSTNNSSSQTGNSAANSNPSRPTFPTGVDPTVPPPPPTDSSDSADSEPEKVAQPVYDPLAAQKSIEVGQFYLKQGNYDAAIDRFNDAVRQHPGFGKPFELLGEAYEKKRDYASAIKNYQQCLRIYPHDPDRKKIEAHIADLQKKQQEESGQK